MEPSRTPARCYLVTGAASGIGRAIAQGLLDDGHRVVAVARRAPALAELVRAHDGARAEVCDLSDPDAVAALYARVAEALPHLDAVVHCAGIYGPIGPFHETDPADWMAAIGNNLFGFYLVARGAVPLLRGGHLPRILACSGGGAFTPLPRCSAYGSAKAGIVRLVETAAEELAPEGIAALALAPGFVATGIHRQTLAAGPEKAGRDYYDFTRAGLEGGGVPMSLVVDCARFLLGDAAFALSGRTVSASFDPWAEPEFRDSLAEIARSDLYRSARVNLRHLPAEDGLRTALTPAQARTWLARAGSREGGVQND